MKEQLEKLPVPILEWYRDNARTLPWRSDPTPYHVWLSEIMLQQTRVAAVMEYYRRFLEECPTVTDLAALSEERLMKLWQGLGYYNRARNLQKTAKIVAREYDGNFPADYGQIRALPGVGDYTAGAICSIAFGLPVPAVDGNVLRVVSRLTGDESDITSAQTKKRMASELSQVIPVKAAGDFNQALMELGATVCLPNGSPLCTNCPASTFCAAHLSDRTDSLPVKAPRKARRIEQRDVFLIFRNKRIALRKRPERGLLAGLWEYPHELSPCSCPVKGRTETPASGKHIFTHVEWHMSAHIVWAECDELPEGWVWAGREELAKVYAVPNAFSCFAHLVDERI